MKDKKFFRRKKFCNICANRMDVVDYKDLDLLRKYVSERGKIIARKQTGVCAKHQRKLTTAINRARLVGLLPFAEK